MSANTIVGLIALQPFHRYIVAFIELKEPSNGLVGRFFLFVFRECFKVLALSSSGVTPSIRYLKLVFRGKGCEPLAQNVTTTVALLKF